MPPSVRSSALLFRTVSVIGRVMLESARVQSVTLPGSTANVKVVEESGSIGPAATDVAALCGCVHPSREIASAASVACRRREAARLTMSPAFRLYTRHEMIDHRNRASILDMTRCRHRPLAACIGTSRQIGSATTGAGQGRLSWPWSWVAYWPFAPGAFLQPATWTAAIRMSAKAASLLMTASPWISSAIRPTIEDDGNSHHAARHDCVTNGAHKPACRSMSSSAPSPRHDGGIQVARGRCASCSPSRYWIGVSPVHRLNARTSGPGSEYPSRYAICCRRKSVRSR